MHAFDILGDPVRRRILELLADGERPSGAIAAVSRAGFGVSQRAASQGGRGVRGGGGHRRPAVSRQWRVMRESGFATVRPEGTRRLYAVEAAPLRELDDWLE